MCDCHCWATILGYFPMQGRKVCELAALQSHQRHHPPSVVCFLRRKEEPRFPHRRYGAVTLRCRGLGVGLAFSLFPLLQLPVAFERPISFFGDGWGCHPFFSPGRGEALSSEALTGAYHIAHGAFKCVKEGPRHLGAPRKKSGTVCRAIPIHPRENAASLPAAWSSHCPALTLRS